jgi:hypothetical protein
MLLFSRMSKEELHREIRRLEQEEKEALRQGWESQVAILRQKVRLARSYLIDPSTVQTNAWYEVEAMPGRFFVRYLNGVMAWGHWEGSKEEMAYPIAALKPIR